MKSVLKFIKMVMKRKSFEEAYLERSIDRADFAAREKRLNYMNRNVNNFWI